MWPEAHRLIMTLSFKACILEEVDVMRNMIAVFVLLLFAGAFIAPAATGVSPARRASRFGRLGRSLNAAKASPIEGKYGWMLKSPRFRTLSPAGKRAVRQSTGLLSQSAPAASSGSGLTPSGSAVTGEPLENVRVNNPALDVAFHTHDNSTVATDGTYIAVSFDDDAGFAGGYAISSDGGQTFAQSAVPEPAQGLELGDGGLAFAPNGTLFYSCVDEQEDEGIAVASSTDHGKTFSSPATISGAIGGANALQDAPSIVVDQGAGSPFKGNVYVAWATFGSTGSNTISFALSSDAGSTFQAPVTLPAPPAPPADSFLGFIEGPAPVVGPKGELYVFYYAGYQGSLGPLGSQILFVKSTDGGTTFGPATVAASFFTLGVFQGQLDSFAFQGEQVYTGGQDGVASVSYPRAAVDQNGNVGVVFEGAGLSATAVGTDPSNVYFTRSSNGGSSFSAPIQINDDGGLTTQWRPSIAVTPSGVFGVKWFDRRNDPAHDSLNDVYMAISSDGGNTFGKNFRLTDTNWLFGEIDPSLNSVAQPDAHGFYDTIAALGETFLCSWSDERSGKSDIYFAVAPASFDSSSPDFAISPHQNYSGVVAAGSPATVGIDNLSVNEFAAPIALSASAPVDGFSFSFSPAQVNPGQSAVLTISASASAPPGPYTITISGTAGSLVRNTTLSLTVFEPGHQAGVPVNATNTRGNTMRSAQSVTCDSNGTLHMCFLDDTEAPGTLQIHYAQSSDGGNTFTSPILVDGGAIQSQGARGKPRRIAKEARETDDEESTSFASLASEPGSTAASSSEFAPTTLFASPGPTGEPGIAVDPSGNIYISNTGIVVFDNDKKIKGQVLLYKSTDGGKTFSAPTVAATASCDSEISEQAIAADKSGNIVIAYESVCDVPNARPENNLHLVAGEAAVTISKDGGGTFSSPQMISGNVFGDIVADLPLHIAFDSKGGLYVLFSGAAGAAIGPGAPGKALLVIDLAVASDGVHFAKPTTVFQFDFAKAATDLFFDETISTPDVLIDSNGQLFVSFVASTLLGEDDLYVMSSTDGGSSFSTPVNITNTGDVVFSSVFSDSAGNVGYLFTRKTQGILEGRSSDGGKTFFQIENVSGHLPSVIGHTEITADPSGNLYAYWATTVGGSTDIYVCKFH
jgi:hypothetical protein